MMRHRCHGALCVALGALLLPGTVSAREVVEVFRVSDQIIAGAGDATVYTVDAMQRFTDQLSIGLPRTSAEAQPVARARLEALTAQDKAGLQRMATGLIRAAEYRITKAPAIVFDGKAVVYGLADVEQARRLYHAWRARSGS